MQLHGPAARSTVTALGLAGLLVASVAAGGLAAPSSARSPAQEAGSPGARSLHDPFYPSLGNGGYDVQQYDLAFEWTAAVPAAVRASATPSAPARPTASPAAPGTTASPGRADLGSVAADATVRAVAMHDLSAFSLDLTRDNTAIESVSLDGAKVAWAWDEAGRKLLIAPTSTIPDGSTFDLRVRYAARPGLVTKTGEDVPPATPGEDAAAALRTRGRGFLADGAGGFLLAAQPNGAHTLFPSNDYPTDKAVVTVRLTAPAGMLGVASGALAGLTSNPDGSTTSVWRSVHPVATHVLAMGIGHYALLGGTGPAALPLRFAVPTRDVPISAPVLSRVPDILAWLEGRLGAYPFETFGLLAYAGEASEAILEGQTLVLMPDVIFDPRLAACDILGAIAHEAAHQWFGDDVSLVSWDQKWLSEGHATFYEWSWRDADSCDQGGLESRMRAAYEGAQAARDGGGPPARPVSPDHAYDDTIYGQGALALYALQQEVGADVFAIDRAHLPRAVRGRQRVHGRLHRAGR